VDPAHESRCRTPYVHAFHIEPAFLGRDLLVHVEKEGDEHVLEVEVEYALTRRLLILPELPYHWTEDDDGFGDAGLGFRALVAETHRYLLSAQVAFEFPTAQRDLGADEVVVSSSLLAWGDVGSCFSVQAGVTLSHGVDSGDMELSWGATLGKSFCIDPLFRGPCNPCADPHGDHAHASYVTLFVEGRGEYALSGPDEGASAHEALLGVSLPIASSLEARAGASLRWDDEDDASPGWVLGFVLHF
jgi:hypothetical protein